MIYFRKFIFLLLFLFSYCHIQASYCYHGIIRYELFAENDKLQLLVTYKDGNNISYISQSQTTVADDINLSGFEVVKELEEAIVFKTDQAYYYLRKTRYEEGTKLIEKLYNVAEVSDVADGCFFRVGGVWRCVYPKYFKEQVVKKALPVLPKSFKVVRWYYDYDYKLLLADKQNLYIVDYRDGSVRKTFVSSAGFEIIAESPKGGLIVKANQNVYTYNRDSDEKGLLKKIPKLTASQTRISYHENYYESYLSDDDTFYELNSNLYYSDLTSEFNFMGKKNGLAADSIIRSRDISFFDTDSTLWVRANISMRDGPTVTFYPLKDARFIDENNRYILYKNKIYQTGWDAAYQLNNVNEDEARKIVSLRQMPGYTYLTDGESVYYGLKKIDWLTPRAKHFYGRRMTSFYEDGDKLYQVDNNNVEKPLSEWNIDTPLKHLKLAYASKDYLIIEGRVIKNIADKNSMEFIGSTLRLVRPCDDARTPPYKIDFFYFFKDKDKVYYYYTGLNQMKVIGGLNPVEYEIDNYTHLKILESHTNEEPIEDINDPYFKRNSYKLDIKPEVILLKTQNK